jgi:predicted RNA-binding Zn-ribbon protein involved in translation (DUF1610 family)
VRVDQEHKKTGSGQSAQGVPEQNDENRFVTCDYCDAELELSDEELAQGWYVCPECDELSHLDEPAASSAAEKPPLEPSAAQSQGRDSDADWVQLKTAAGPEEAALEVAYLHANGVEAFAQQGAGQAFGVTLGLVGTSHVMVRKDQLELARSIIESEAQVSPDEDQPADDSLSGISKAAMGPAALALNPIGAGLAIGAAQLVGRRDAEDQAFVVECAQCGVELELSDQEVAQGYFICPECQQLIELSDYVVCPVCQSQLALDNEERVQGWYRCPECDQVTNL